MIKLKVKLSYGLKWLNPNNNGCLKMKPELTVGSLMFRVRMLLTGISAADALFLFFNSQTLYAMTATLAEVHEKESVDGVLNVVVVKESAFGGRPYPSK